MLKIARMVTLMLAASLVPVFAQGNAVERTLPTPSGMSMIAWGFMALIIAIAVIWTMRSRRGGNTLMGGGSLPQRAGQAA